jgi:hypothetical protein
MPSMTGSAVTATVMRLRVAAEAIVLTMFLIARVVLKAAERHRLRAFISTRGPA